MTAALALSSPQPGVDGAVWPIVLRNSVGYGSTLGYRRHL